MKKIIIFVNLKIKYHNKILNFLKKKYYVDVVSSEDTLIKKQFLKKKYDYFFCLYSHFKFNKSFLKNSKIALNFHPALPKYPGSCGYNWALYNNDKFHGITVHNIDEKIDHGAIIYVKKFKILNNDNLYSLIKKSFYWQYKVFFLIFSNIIKKNNFFFSSVISSVKWSSRTYKKKDLKKIENIRIKLNYKNVHRLVRSLSYNEFGPIINIGKYKFKYISHNENKKNF
jgi:methionyl-tRNA formyltransferase